MADFRIFGTENLMVVTTSNGMFNLESQGTFSERYN